MEEEKRYKNEILKNNFDPDVPFDPQMGYMI
jgi:hypothetical protein